MKNRRVTCCALSSLAQTQKGYLRASCNKEVDVLVLASIA